MSAAFEITRADGRSNSQVLLDLFEKGELGRLYKYEELSAALSEGVDKTYTNSEITGIIGKIYIRLLKEQQKAVHSVRGVGYRLALADDHKSLALDRKQRADGQLLKGLETLRGVQWDKIKDPEVRKATEGQLLILSAIYNQTQALERRQNGIEEALRRLSGPKED